MDSILDFVEQNFNAIRIPFSVKFGLSDYETTYPEQQYVGYGLENMRSWDILDLVIEKAADRGIVILLDMHLIDDKLDWSPLWYEGNYTEADTHQAWFNIMERYSTQWNIFGIDIRNEPHNEGKNKKTKD